MTFSNVIQMFYSIYSPKLKDNHFTIVCHKEVATSKCLAFFFQKFLSDYQKSC